MHNCHSGMRPAPVGAPVRRPAQPLGRAALRLAVLALLAALPLAGAPPRLAAAEPLKIVVGFAAGSGLDVIARVIAARVQTSTGTTVIVENRAGAGGRLAAEVVAQAEPDGATVLCAPIVTTAFTPFIYHDLRFDPLSGLAPITRLGNFKFALAVNNDVSANTFREFVAYAKSNPGKIGYGTPGVGTPAHFLGVMLNRATGTDLFHVPYRGSGPATTALLGREVASGIIPTPVLLPLHRDRQIKLLAVTGATRAAALPEVPTFGELKMNLGDMESAELWYGFLAPGRTPAAGVQKLNAVLVAALSDPAVREKLQTLDVEVATDTPAAFAEIVKADYARWGKVIRESGFKLND